MTAMEWGVILRWYLVLQILSVPFVYLSRRFFFALPDQGYAIAKSLTVLLVGFGSWLSFAWLQIPFTTGLPWLVWLLCCGLVWKLRRHELHRHFRRGTRWPAGPARAAVWTTEVIFALVYVGWIWVVAHDPGIEHTEQPMDFMFINSLWATSQYPPQDAWLAGFPVSYYYFGYWMLVCLAKAVQAAPSMAYNLGQANWYALLWLGAWGFGYNVAAVWRKGRQPGQQGQGTSVAAGVLSGLCVAGMGNLQGFFEALYAFGIGQDHWYARLQVRNFPAAVARAGRDWLSDSSWWWWRSARVISDRDLDGNHLEVIAEFPMFSYILGDNHPHVLFAPFLFVAMSLALQWIIGPSLQVQPGLQTERRQSWGARIKAMVVGTDWRLGYWGLALVLVGAAYFGNAWDLVTILLLLTVSMSTGYLRLYTRRLGTWCATLAGVALLLLAGAAVLILPYLLTAQSQVEGLQLNWSNPTRPVQLAVMWGPLLLSGGLYLLVFAPRSLKRVRHSLYASLLAWLIPGLVFSWAWWSGLGASTLSAFTPDRTVDSVLIRERWTGHWLTPAILGLLLGLGGAQFSRWWWQDRGQPTDNQAVHAFVLLCLTAGFLLLYMPEFIFLRDRFGSLMRMNTVFKFHYQAWHLLAPVMAVTVVLGLARPWRWPTFCVSAFLSLLLLAGMVYPVAGIGSKVQGSADEKTLDIYHHLGKTDPAVADALVWLQTHVPAGTVIAEAPGQSYLADASRVSGFTGLVTLLGWTGHEAQWRGSTYSAMIAGREEALQLLYATGTREEILQTMEDWNIQYIYLGVRERQQYAVSTERLELLRTLLDPVYGKHDILVLANPAYRADP